MYIKEIYNIIYQNNHFQLSEWTHQSGIQSYIKPWYIDILAFWKRYSIFYSIFIIIYLNHEIFICTSFTFPCL